LLLHLAQLVSQPRRQKQASVQDQVRIHWHQLTAICGSDPGCWPKVQDYKHRQRHQDARSLAGQSCVLSGRLVHVNGRSLVPLQPGVPRRVTVTVRRRPRRRERRVPPSSWPPGHRGAELSMLPAAVPMRRGSNSGPEPRSDSDSGGEEPGSSCPGTKGDSSKSTRAAAAPGAFDPPCALPMWRLLWCRSDYHA
jgi:hypothetical protein